MSQDGRSHRGAHQEDFARFDGPKLPILRQAVSELSWLLTRGYAMDSALKLVGDRHQLHLRQRLALRRSACSDQARVLRQAHRRTPGEVGGQLLRIDGFNLLISVESALSGGVLIRGRDGCLRDLASVHGTYRAVQETGDAIGLVGALLAEIHPGPVLWYLDRPVSNSGLLRGYLLEAAATAGWPWSVEVVLNPDRELVIGSDPVVTSDSAILDHGLPWLDLLGILVERRLPEAWLIDLSGSELQP